MCSEKCGIIFQFGSFLSVNSGFAERAMGCFFIKSRCEVIIEIEMLLMLLFIQWVSPTD